MVPDVLNIIGELPGPEYKYLCVIGARKYTAYGQKACQRLVSSLKGYPVAIVSGLAIGIDSMAHETALEVGLKTVAFPGSGLDRKVLYPSSKRTLAERIIQSGGALVSSFSNEQASTQWTFPVRNQLMAAISHAVLIVEGAEKSGTLLTAGYAAEMNRDLMVVPGSIFEPTSYGPHSLLREGAMAISNSNDLLDDLGFSTGQSSRQFSSQNIALSPDHQKIVAQLQISPLSASELMIKIGLSVMQIQTLISQLELAGIVQQNQGVYRINY